MTVIKAVGKGWGPGIHNLFYDGKPARLLVPPETIKPTFDLIKSKIKSDKVLLGIDHLDEDILKQNEILAKMDLLNVGEVKQVATDGKDIYITDSEITNPQIKELHAKGELPAFSIVGPAKVHECERNDVDFVLDFFHDIKRFDFVEQGGCQTCKVGKQPTELILASKLSMEVDTVSKNVEITQDEYDELKKFKNDFEELKPKYEKGEKLYNEGKKKFEELQKEEADLREQLIPVWKEKDVNASKSKTDKIIESRISKLEKITEKAKQEAKKAKDEAKLEAKKATVEKDIDAKIMAGYATPAMKNTLLKAGIACETEEEYKELMAGLKTKVWEGGKLSASNPEDDGDPETLDMDGYRKSRKING